jgi:hypothetical protein
MLNAMTPVSTTAFEAVLAARPPANDWLDRARRILGGQKHPADYLPLTPDVADVLDRDLSSLRAELGTEPAAETVRRQRTQYLLSYHFGGQNVACLNDECGVIVLAVGVDRIAEFVREVPYELCRDVAYTTPDVWM